VPSSPHDKWPVLGKQTLTTANGMLNQRRGLKIPESLRPSRNALRV